MAGEGSLSFYCQTNYRRLSEILKKGSVEMKDVNIRLTNESNLMGEVTIQTTSVWTKIISFLNSDDQN
jgi:hypothetical protein